VDFVLLLFLILLNGVFAMVEIALVSSRKLRLQRLAEDGSPGANTALALHNDPANFLSTIQVGITSVGILSGAIGESALADPLTLWLSQFAFIQPYARPVSLTLVVIGLTYFSVVVGELVPKRLGLLAPEGIASLVAKPMNVLSSMARPLVWLLSSSSDLILRLLGAQRSDEHPVTDYEINELMGQGAESGVFHKSEQEIVSNVLRLDEQRIGVIMTHRSDLFLVDLARPENEIREKLIACPFQHLIVCRHGLDNIVGILRRVDLLAAALDGAPLDIEGRTRAPLYVPESLTTFQLMENFRRARTNIALIVDEYGHLEGLVTLTDVLAYIVGDELLSDAPEDRDFVQREDGSWLIDGGASIERLKYILDTDSELSDEEENGINTVAGFIMHRLGRIPAEADFFEWDEYRFEVVDMDKNRIDKVLVSRRMPPSPYPAQ
jgi:putative hemolysin